MGLFKFLRRKRPKTAAEIKVRAKEEFCEEFCPYSDDCVTYLRGDEVQRVCLWDLFNDEPREEE